MNYRWIWFKASVRRFYYKMIHGIIICERGTMLPNVGKGKYVSIYRKGNFFDLVDEQSGDFVRMIPYQPNHGFMVETWTNGRLTARTALDHKALRNFSEGQRESF